MPAKDKKSVKILSASDDKSSKKPEKVSMPEVNLEEPPPVNKPPVKAKTVEFEESDKEELQTEEETTKTNDKPELQKTEDNKKSEPEITSFAQLDTKAPVTAAAEEKPVAAKSILDPEPEDFEDKTQTPEIKNEPEVQTEEPAAEKSKGEISSDEIKEWLKEVRPDTTKEVEKSNGPSFKPLLLVLLGLLLLGLIGGAAYYYKTKIQPAQVTEVTEEPTAAVEEPTATPVIQSADYSKYTLRVLNGSGVAGEAGRVVKLFDDFEFKEASAGNADKSDYSTTTVSLKKDVPEAVYEAIKNKLSSEFTVEKSDSPVEETSDYDIIVTVGSKKSE